MSSEATPRGDKVTMNVLSAESISPVGRVVTLTFLSVSFLSSSFQKGLGVTHEMEIRTIAALRKLCIEVIISPYEADAQLAHLCQIGFCDSVLTEDSDILVYSAICGIPFNVFYKFDRVGAVQVINFGDINLIGANSDSESDALDLPISQSSDDGSSSRNNKSSSKSASKEEKSFLPLLKNFKGPSGRRMFAQMCILAGCDYSESIFGVGIIAAQKVRHDLMLCRAFANKNKLTYTFFWFNQCMLFCSALIVISCDGMGWDMMG